MRELKTEIHIEQVIDGIEYKGHVHFGDSYKFQYKLRCDQSIGVLDKLAVDDLEVAKRQMHIDLKDSGGRAVAIPEDLVPLFQGLILPLAAEFYANPQTRHANSYESRSLDAQLAVFGASRSVGMTTSCRFDGDQLEPVLAKYFKSYCHA
jgi:hypothetical protein